MSRHEDPRLPGRYILDAHGEPVRCDDLATWARWFETPRVRHVAEDLDEGDPTKTIRVSTVFLALDHNFSGKGPPVLWETMVFGGALDSEQRRYTSRAAALRGHQEMCERVRASLTKGHV